MKDISFQPLRKIFLNISVVDLRNNSRRLSYYKGFIPQKIGKYCLLLPILKNSFIDYFTDLEWRKQERSVTKSEYYFQLAIHLYPWEFYTKIKKKKRDRDSKAFSFILWSNIIVYLLLRFRK